MEKDDIRYRTYVRILKDELVPAMGCTEPIALAYAAAKAREVLGKLPKKVLVEASGSIIKNVKSVIVPNTGHLKGIPAAVAAGIVAGDANRKLEVISDVDDNKKCEIADFMNNIKIDVIPLDIGYVFDLIITLFADDEYVKIRITNQHTNIVLIEKNNGIIFESEIENNAVSGSADTVTKSNENSSVQNNKENSKDKPLKDGTLKVQPEVAGTVYIAENRGFTLYYFYKN